MSGPVQSISEVMVGPIAVLFLVAAVASAFLKAKNEQQARYHRTTEPPAGEERILPRSAVERYTEEGEAYLRRARRYRLFLYGFGLAAILATWRGL